jgi:hypothetical protein
METGKLLGQLLQTTTSRADPRSIQLEHACSARDNVRIASDLLQSNAPKNEPLTPARLHLSLQTLWENPSASEARPA